MRARPIAAALLLAGAAAGLLALAGRPAAVVAQPAPPRDLPGLTRDGFVQLPNQWRLRPAGQALDLGDLPVHAELHPSGDYLAVLHAGFREHEVAIVGLKGKRRVLSRVTLEQTFYGLTWSPDGKSLYASGGEFERVHAWDFDAGLLGKPRTIALPKAPARVIGGLAISPDGKELYAAATWGDALFRVPAADPKRAATLVLAPPGGVAQIPEAVEQPKQPDPKGEPSPDDGRYRFRPAKGLECYPYTILPEPGGRRLFVSLWSQACVAVVDLAEFKVTGHWKTQSHPTEMALTPDGKHLYVACANSTQVSVLDTSSGAAVQTIGCALYPTAPNGNTPNSLALTPDGQLLFVANADANNLTVLNVSDPAHAKPLGFIPTGWYPTSVRYHAGDKRLYVTNGKGTRSRPNAVGPGPRSGGFDRNLYDYIGGLFQGSLLAIDLPAPEALAQHTATAYQCSPLRDGSGVPEAAIPAGLPANHPIPRKLGDKSPIEYVFYVVKENRTYDQVFGDIPKGNGDPNLCLFPETVTPNHHALANEFVLLDNLYVDGEVSADGHEWTMGAYATDYVEKAWPLSYRGSPRKRMGYPSEGQTDAITRPSGGYLWDRAIEAGVSFRSYGEWCNNGKTADDPCTPAVPALVGRIDPGYRSYDLEYTDVKRADRFLSELAKFEKAGDMPRLQVIKLPNDHTSGTRKGAPTPTAMVADNDLALGRIVEGISKSKFWPKCAIFVIEDDTQNGPDHVDAHRSVALVISPYVKRKSVDSSLYSTSSMLRTMELILGLKPMSQFDAAARPMYASFGQTPDNAPYTHRVPKTDLNAKNGADAFGAKWCESPDLARKEDAVDDLIFSEIIWRSVKGADSPMPAPVRAAFFRPRD